MAANADIAKFQVRYRIVGESWSRWINISGSGILAAGLFAAVFGNCALLFPHLDTQVTVAQTGIPGSSLARPATTERRLGRIRSRDSIVMRRGIMWLQSAVGGDDLSTPGRTITEFRAAPVMIWSCKPGPIAVEECFRQLIFPDGVIGGSPEETTSYIFSKDCQDISITGIQATVPLITPITFHRLSG